MKKVNTKAFTLVEILIVVAIIAILATISAPMLMQHRNRAVASESVAVMALIRQAQRDYHINHTTYFDVAHGDIPNSPSDSSPGVDVDVGVAQYFSNKAYMVDATNYTSTANAPEFKSSGTVPAVDFLIQVDGSSTNNDLCSSSVQTNCALNADKVGTYDLEMDNSGRIFVSYDNGTSWKAY